MERNYVMSKKYQITLTPVDKYFFGGDMKFKVGNKGEEEHYASYIIRSEMFPQQTSLLGMLRFLILKNGGKEVFTEGKIQDPEKAKDLIGEQSFVVDETKHEKKNFGKILGLSHVKIRRMCGGQCIDLDFAPLFKEIDFSNSSSGTYNLKPFCIPDITENDYKAKDGLSTLLTDGVKTYPLDEIFKENRRMGIDRNINTGKTEDNAMFKQISYRFSDKSHYCFVFDVEVSEGFALDKYNGQMVSVGADNSQFIISISDTIVTNPDIKPVNNAVYLLSPAFLTQEDVRLAKFAITNLVPFRFLKSTLANTPDSYRITRGGLGRSKRYELYAPGSVFYFDTEENRMNFINKLEEKQEFRQIGYNEYK